MQTYEVDTSKSAFAQARSDLEVFQRVPIFSAFELNHLQNLTRGRGLMANNWNWLLVSDFLELWIQFSELLF